MLPEWPFPALENSLACDCGSPVVKVWDHGRRVMSSSPISLKTRRVGVAMHVKSVEIKELKRPPIGVEVRRGGAVLVT
ncbi:hypothetical protein TNCV_4249351 [Trichonephila clavipes]|nr:hypothetical protein TNCV_4249351 [Trichonephila clavipes]